MFPARRRQPDDKGKHPQTRPAAPHPRPPPDIIPPNFRPLLCVWLVRHGETNENVRGIVQGTMDTDLNEHGVHQARLVAEALKDIPFHAAATSDLKRASVTAQIIVSKHPGLTLKVDPGLRERCCGEREGMLPEVYKARKAQIKDWGESDEVFGKRIHSWFKDFLNNIHNWVQLQQGMVRHVLFVSHGAYITSLVMDLVYGRHILNPHCFRIHGVYNTGVTCIGMAEEVAVLQYYNNINHLPRAEPVVKKNVDAESVPKKNEQVKMGATSATVAAPVSRPRSV